MYGSAVVKFVATRVHLVECIATRPQLLYNIVIQEQMHWHYVLFTKTTNNMQKKTWLSLQSIALLSGGYIEPWGR